MFHLPVVNKFVACRLKEVDRLTTKIGGPLVECQKSAIKHKNGVWPCSLVCGKGRKPVAAPGRVKGEEQLSVVKIKMSQCGKLLF